MKNVNGALFIRDLVNFINSRNEHLNDGKTVEQLINDFCLMEYPDPNYYGDGISDPIGFKENYLRQNFRN